MKSKNLGKKSLTSTMAFVSPSGINIWARAFACLPSCSGLSTVTRSSFPGYLTSSPRDPLSTTAKIRVRVTGSLAEKAHRSPARLVSSQVTRRSSWCRRFIAFVTAEVSRAEMVSRSRSIPTIRLSASNSLDENLLVLGL